MKKIIYSALCVAALAAAPSCSDYLDTSSPSTVDGEFVFSNMTTARTAMDGAYEAWRGTANSHVFGAGLYYASDVASDIGRHPEAYTAQPLRHVPESFYENGTLTGSYSNSGYQSETNAYTNLYATISKCNAITTAMENASYFEEIMSAGTPSNQTQLYGEAVALRATCYRELIKYYGDVPYNDTFGVPAGGIAPRDSIYDVVLEQLQVVEPLMYRVGENGVAKDQMSRTYVQGLIGRMALDAGGYQTRRSDLTYVDGEGNALTFQTLGTPNTNAGNAVYGRRSDWQTKYQLAKQYFGECLANSGSAQLLTTDPRSSDNGRTYGNPYQYFFQEMHMPDETFATESIYEYVETQGSDSDERPYSNGRPSSGGSTGLPAKSYGQFRVNPAFYYGVFDPNDMRRDVSITVTGSNGAGVEKLIPFAPGSTTNGGGLSLNKWDECRQDNHYTGSRRSGINGPYMRMAEIYLGYAEACAALGDTSTAETYLKIIRERSFPAGKANTADFISAQGGTLNAVIAERGFEFAAEGDRHWTLIRTGLLPEKIKEIKELTLKMINGLETNGSYTFENGNTISSKIYTKLVDAKSLYGHRLTAQCDDPTNPVLYPGWRGQNDDWGTVALNANYSFTETNETNLAIKGLFTPVSAAEAEALIEDGYTEVAWGSVLVDYKDDYYTYVFYKYDYSMAPIYLWPFTPNICATAGLHNGYGFTDD